MTCGKCERLIKEAVSENVPEVSVIEVFRPEGYATITLKKEQNIYITLNENIKNNVLKSIHALVNGKFKAAFEPGKKIFLRKMINRIQLTLKTYTFIENFILQIRLGKQHN